MHAPPKRKTRFSFYCLEEGEEYIEETIADYCPKGQRQKQRGRLRICSNSLCFEPDDVKLPITKFAFRSIQERHIYPTSENAFSLTSSSVVNLLQHGLVGPHETADSDGPHTFTLAFQDAETFLKKLNNLLCLARIDSTMARAKSLKLLMQQNEAEYKFDYSWLSDVKEKILYQHCAYRVIPLVRIRGRLLVTDMGLYFQAFNNIDATPVVRVPSTDVTRIERRRYMLREIALEIQTKGDQVLLITFDIGEEQEREQLVKVLLGQASLARVVTSDIRRVMRRWQHGEISTFDYLMFLNWCAGRSLNDLSQYPVFPWILKDYTSSELDLSNPGVYRDLRKPVGALNAKRLAHFKERMAEMIATDREERRMEEERPKKTLSSFLGLRKGKKKAMPTSPSVEPSHSSSAPYLYGTHYSTPAYVLYFLIRLVPEYMLLLHKGKFDDPDRIFDSIEDCWLSVINNTGDVKELIPEFFFGNGEFLEHKQHAHLDFGMKQNSQKVRENVQLPPWAKNSAREFVAIHRAALEGEFVSAHIHHWIDLIFGCNQRGDRAVAHDNVFHPLTYGDIDLESIDDEIYRNALEIQIREFGQTPKQLFTDHHPKRAVPATPPDRITFDTYILQQQDPSSSDADADADIGEEIPVPASPTSLPSAASPVSRGRQATGSGSPTFRDVAPAPAPLPVPVPAPLPAAPEAAPPAPEPRAPVSATMARQESTGSSVLDRRIGRVDSPLTRRGVPATRARLGSEELDNGSFGSAALDNGSFAGLAAAADDLAGLLPATRPLRVEDLAESPLPSPALRPRARSVSSRSSGDEEDEYAAVAVYSRSTASPTSRGPVARRSRPPEAYAGLKYAATVKAHKEPCQCLPLVLHKDPAVSWLAGADDGAEDRVVVYTASSDGTVKIHDMLDGRKLRSFTNFGSSRFAAMQMTRSLNGLLFLGSLNNNIYAFKPDSGSLVDTVSAHDSGVSCLALTSDDRLLVSGAWDSSVKFWHVGDGGVRGTAVAEYADVHEEEVKAIAIDPSNRMAVSVAGDGMLTLFDLRGSTHRIKQTPTGLAALTSTAWLDREHFAVASEDGLVQLYHVGYDSPVITLPRTQASCVAVSAGALLVGTTKGTLGVYEINKDTATPLATLDGGGLGEVACIAVTADDGHIVAADAAGQVALWSFPQQS